MAVIHQHTAIREVIYITRQRYRDIQGTLLTETFPLRMKGKFTILHLPKIHTITLESLRGPLVQEWAPLGMGHHHLV